MSAVLAVMNSCFYLAIARLPLGTVKGRMRLGLQKIKNYFESRDAAVPR